MPNKDGRGPISQGSGRRGGRGQGGGSGMGASGECFCPKCGMTMTHTRGVPCSQLACPACGAAMVRK